MEIRQLTFTRFIAALIIIVFHYGQGCFPFNNGLFQHFAREGAFAVSYFFCLSGYILVYVYYKPDNILNNKMFFYKKRFARIYPLYLLGFVTALFSGIILFHSIPKGNSIILQLFGLHAWVPGICLEINFPAWSLSVEFFFYLCFPFLLKLFEIASVKKIIYFTLSIWIISVVSHILLKSTPHPESRSWEEFILYNPLFHINTFIFGMAASVMKIRTRLSLTNFASNTIFLLTCVLLFLIITMDNSIIPYAHNGLLAPLFAIIIISLHVNQKGITSIFAFEPLIFLGNISFGMYILQFPVRVWFEQILKYSSFNLSKSVLFYLYLITLIFISALTYLYIEKPLRK